MITVKTLFSSEKALFFFYALFMGVFVWKMPVSTGDDAIFINYRSSLEWIYIRYMSWSSRIVIDAIVPELCRHTVFFKGITFGMLLTLPVLMAKIICPEEKTGYVYGICFLYCLFPMGGAGWIATMVNYYYVLFALCLSVYLLRFRDTNFLFAILILCAFYCINQEQACFLFLCVLAANIWQGNRDGRILFLGCLTIAMLLFIITAPGNRLRFASEITTWYPEFTSLSIVFKIYLGIAATLYNYILTPNPISLFLLFCIFIHKYRSLQESLARMLLLFSVVALHGFFVLSPSVAFQKENSVYLKDFSSIAALPCFYFVVSILCCAYVVYQCCQLLRDRDLRAKALLIFGAGLASRFVMGLSPTLFASGERTFLFCDFALLALSLLFFTTARLPCKSYVVWGAVAMRLMLCCGKFA